MDDILSSGKVNSIYTFDSKSVIIKKNNNNFY